MNFRQGMFWLTVFATLAGAVAVYMAWPHPSSAGLQEHSELHVNALPVIFFYAWGGVMACGSPLLYLWLWYQTRGTRMEDSEGL
jgi:hypothetical protein